MTALSGKTAVVTGGSRGIGAAIVRQFAQAGANVAFTYARSGEAAQQLVTELEAAGAGALAIQADSANPSEISAAIARATQQFGQLDVLVNNAGVFEVKSLNDCTLEDYEHVMNINTRAVFMAMRDAAKIIQDKGRIINIGSNLAERVPQAGLTLYTMSKAAVWGLTKAAARDLGHRGITVNIIQPGSTDTDMNPADGPHADHQRQLRAIPVYNSPDDIAAMAVYLASDAAQHITGSSLLVDGGANI
ncbi:SDR family NAD(P)-dependent oxidoreductase [Allopusillimonas ginsengisoli]|uniref:SDR family NAD(P)-dependent oxidoreductase n=1 Tax=Allopusillimonas ginsengisoli TaxID=453575 RepID=UPI001020013C|nr:SDR family oxidoreductase [Allopusillimonas ginsengisoli]TEA79444.1 SDR family oxidoreductase [Allopusillimonas ginsengisoli]